MHQNDIYRLIKLASDAEIEVNDKKIEKDLKKLIDFTKELDNNFSEYLKKLATSHVRFCDYYNEAEHHKDKILEYFQNNFVGSMREDYTIIFSLYVFLKNIESLVENIDEFSNLEDLYFLLDNNYYFEDVFYIMSCLENILLKNNEVVDSLPFMNDQNKYKIFFAGYSYDDITRLEKVTLKSLVNKLSGQLSQSDSVTLAELIDHVKDKYGVSLFRVQFADDYRIAYIRRNNVTAILGVSLKTGKDMDYKRYDNVAKRIEKLYKDVDKFADGKLEDDADHYKVVDYLTKKYNKNRGL